MQAIVFQDRNLVTLTERPTPRPGAGEVLIEVAASGICHTDIEVLRGNYGTSAYPVVPGHEYAGTITEIGAGVSGLKTGDRVVVDPNLECGTCPACQRGWAHLCDTLGAYGVTCDGGFADFSVVKASRVHPIGDMGFHVAALAEPLGCVLNGLDAGQVHRARSGLIFGAGPIGLLMAIGMRVSGVDDIALVDLDEGRLALAESFGFRGVAAQSSDLEDLQHGVDLVADATGVPAVAGKLTDYIGNGGVGLFFGVCPQDARIEIAPFELFRRQITLAGSHSLNHNIPQALDGLRAYGDDIARIISHQMPLSEIAEVFAGNGPKSSLKIQFSRDL
ncbi:alcohol dehydrogenase catalytic domain-containing protein [Flavimaricola marinus]|uniref:L-threonine 3-dehydrogenase n=1 Tax=Flavimaricola marinus TaxID=1819565 RepID=A0A238LJQ4_9RHOB|nr:alcohol dehydrogenase catalytic domain-containing protein [Flavimaricola marinus]SMY09196.1 L-threonine 3-dehydrogenase [Flavimaricola marinus]